MSNTLICLTVFVFTFFGATKDFRQDILNFDNQFRSIQGANLTMFDMVLGERQSTVNSR